MKKFVISWNHVFKFRESLSEHLGFCGRLLTASVIRTAVFHAPLQSQLQVTSWIHFALNFTQAFQLYFCCCDKKSEKSQSSGEGVAFTLQFQVIALGGAAQVAVSGDSWSGHMTSAVQRGQKWARCAHFLVLRQLSAFFRPRIDCHPQWPGFFHINNQDNSPRTHPHTHLTETNPHWFSRNLRVILNKSRKHPFSHSRYYRQCFQVSPISYKVGYRFVVHRIYHKTKVPLFLALSRNSI